jgi:hypothetical protein
MPDAIGISPSHHVMLPPARAGLPCVTDVWWAEQDDVLAVLNIAA